MVTADYQPDNGLILIADGYDSIVIDLDEAEPLIDRLRQILDEHPEE